MKRNLLLLLSAAALAAAAQEAAAQDVERGRYLTNEIARCGDCHTATLDNGKPDQANLLKGVKKLSFAPLGNPPKWEDHAPDITPTGKVWQRWGEKGLLNFLETGKTPKGNLADPPMPAYTMKHEDAAAVVAYLKSLK